MKDFGEEEVEEEIQEIIIIVIKSGKSMSAAEAKPSDDKCQSENCKEAITRKLLQGFLSLSF